MFCSFLFFLHPSSPHLWPTHPASFLTVALATFDRYSASGQHGPSAPPDLHLLPIAAHPPLSPAKPLDLRLWPHVHPLRYAAAGLPLSPFLIPFFPYLSAFVLLRQLITSSLYSFCGDLPFSVDKQFCPLCWYHVFQLLCTIYLPNDDL